MLLGDCGHRWRAFRACLRSLAGHLGLKSFPATILGGLDSVNGSGFGGVLIGIVENLAGGYLGSGMKDVAGFVMIIVVLMVQPFGLFGERDIVRV